MTWTQVRLYASLVRMDSQNKDKQKQFSFPAGNSDCEKVVWEPLSFDLRGSFAYVLAKYPLFVYTCFKVGGAAAAHKGIGEVNAPKHIYTRCSTTSHTWMILWESEGMTKLSETCSSPSSSSSSHISLSSCLTRTHLPAPSDLQPHTPACIAGGVSCFSNDATSNQWAAVRTVRERGGNSPPISPLPTWEPVLPRGGAPSHPLSEWTPNKNSHQQVSYTSQCWFFSHLLFFPPPSFFFSFMAGTLLYILAGLTK